MTQMQNCGLSTECDPNNLDATHVTILLPLGLLRLRIDPEIINILDTQTTSTCYAV
jgi:hypothetical protein